MREHAWSLDPAGQAAIRRAEDGRTDRVPTLDELFAAVPWMMPTASSRVKVPPKSAEWLEFLHARDGQWRDAIRAAGVEVDE